LLVVGGSLGAQALNERVPAALAQLPGDARPSVVHQAGAAHVEALAAAYRKARVEAECLPFIEDMAARYAWADLVVCRGGALTVAELAAVGLGAVIVPLPGAIADEQTANADFLVKAGAALRIAQSELTPEGLASLIRGMSRERALVMASAAHSVGRRDAADRVADVCAELGGRS
jgi:UDP-N-acetylglucosamine--N-acetylmuramyl-(pentapeptide) pyrophosphoryl-undecaprenol N-acetylglucosamine transferase